MLNYLVNDVMRNCLWLVTKLRHRKGSEITLVNFCRISIIFYVFFFMGHELRTIASLGLHSNEDCSSSLSSLRRWLVYFWSSWWSSVELRHPHIICIGLVWQLTIFVFSFARMFDTPAVSGGLLSSYWYHMHIRQLVPSWICCAGGILACCAWYVALRW